MKNLIVGGDFYENYYLKKNNYFKNKHNLIWANTARTCFEFIIKIIKNDIDKILIPNYLCLDIFIPILKKHKIKFFFYKIKKNLTFSEKLLKNGSKNCILIVDYFGFTNNKIIKSLKKKNYLIIFDMVQSPIRFLNNFLISKNLLNNVDYAFTSFRKTFSIPNGSCFYSKEKISSEELKLKNVKNIDLLWKQAIKKKKDYILRKEKNNRTEKIYLKLFKEIAYLNAKVNGKITQKSQKILSKINFKKHSEDRINKYNFLKSKIRKKFQIFKNNCKFKTPPFFFPILVKNRKFLLNKLRKYNLFFPTHWKIKKEFYKLIKHQTNIYNQEISLVIDHRISYNQLDLVYKIINKYAL